MVCFNGDIYLTKSLFIKEKCIPLSSLHSVEIEKKFPYNFFTEISVKSTDLVFTKLEISLKQVHTTQ